METGRGRRHRGKAPRSHRLPVLKRVEVFGRISEELKARTSRGQLGKVLRGKLFCRQNGHPHMLVLSQREVPKGPQLTVLKHRFNRFRRGFLHHRLSKYTPRGTNLSSLLPSTVQAPALARRVRDEVQGRDEVGRRIARELPLAVSLRMRCSIWMERRSMTR